MTHKIQKIPLKKAEVYYIPDFLSKEEADTLLQFCLKTLTWKIYQVKVYNKIFDQPRQSCMLGKSYKYSGYIREADEMPEEIKVIQDKVYHICSSLNSEHPSLNGCLVNRYPDGKSYIGPHSDDEKDLHKYAFISGLSLGAVRHFDLIPKKKDEEEKYRIDLAHGSLILMGKGCQTHYKHQVPKQLTIKEPRINMTFRVLK